jgi:membrane fusion protein, multidrug efflux system
MKTMISTETQNVNGSPGAMPTTAGRVPTRVPDGPPAATVSPPPHLEAAAKSQAGSAHPSEPQPPATPPPAHCWRKWLLLAGGVATLAAAGYFLVPWVDTTLNTESTDDAYVNGHVTMVAPRVPGHVAQVFVEDNQRVKKGDLLVRLDKEPYLIQVAAKKAAVASAEADLAAANALVRGQVAAARANRFKLQHAMEDVNTQVANLRAAVATLNSRRATLDLSKANLSRGEQLAPSGAMSREELDLRRQTVKVDQAAVDQALEQVYAIRVGLGLPSQPVDGHALTEVPPDLDQTFSAVTSALGETLQSASQFGAFPANWDATPKETLAEFFRHNPGDMHQVLTSYIAKAPAIEQAEARLLQARSALDQAELDLRYCDIVSDIDGVVTSRNVNSGNDVQAGQSLMAVRSLTEIWIDANFKETQLEGLRIGQRVRCEVDMYGSKKEFEGRISGFTMGTGQTLALLPPQNATGNFVKIVQRLPVCIELTGYNPAEAPLFVGLSVTPYVFFKEPPTGPNAGEILQPLAQSPTGAANPQS